MATPALRLIRSRLPGATIGLLVRPGIDQLLSGYEPDKALYDEIHTARNSGVMGPKHTAHKVRAGRYDTALLLTNSFSTALSTRLAGIPRRMGYDRDGRGILLTHKLKAPKADKGYAIIPAVDYYWHAAMALLTLPDQIIDLAPGNAQGGHHLPEGTTMELPVSDADDLAAHAVLASAGIEPSQPFALLNPGGNNPAKRWPAERFAELADHLRETQGLTSLINASPAESDLADQIAGIAASRPINLARHGQTLGSLKAITARARLMVTNDTGPRHIAAALGTPLVSLFGPTDHRWTPIPTRPGAPEILLTADPSLPPSESANDHPERCKIDRIDLQRVIKAADELIQAS